MKNNILENRNIESLIHEIRGQKVMLDFDLAELYQVETKRLKESVRRNIERFEGDDFMFELTSEEYNSLIISLRSRRVRNTRFIIPSKKSMLSDRSCASSTIMTS